MDAVEDNLGQSSFLVPEDKFMYLRLVPACIFLLDTSDDLKAIFRSKGEYDKVGRRAGEERCNRGELEERKDGREEKTEVAK
jgi:hypothetical protein